MEDTEKTRRIWAIREHIDEIEKIKDAIIQLSDMDSVCIGDAKDLYFHIVSSWHLLKSCPTLEGEKLEESAQNVSRYLELAKDKYAQVQSELHVISGTDAVKLGGQLERAFVLFSVSMSDSLEQYLLEPENTPPEKIVRKEGPMEFYLDCVLCGSTATAFIGNLTEPDSSGSILYKGLTTSRTLSMKIGSQIFDLLDRESLRDLHEYLRENTFLEDGIDAYCPKCDTIYCERHLEMQVAYDAGFYDCTYGTCPEGHRRIIDD